MTVPPRRVLNPGTEPAGGELLRKGSIRYPHGSKAFYNHGILFRLSKKSLKYLHMCKICCTFVPDFKLRYIVRAWE